MKLWRIDVLTETFPEITRERLFTTAGDLFGWSLHPEELAGALADEEVVGIASPDRSWELHVSVSATPPSPLRIFDERVREAIARSRASLSVYALGTASAKHDAPREVSRLTAQLLPKDTRALSWPHLGVVSCPNAPMLAALQAGRATAGSDFRDPSIIRVFEDDEELQRAIAEARDHLAELRAHRGKFWVKIVELRARGPEALWIEVEQLRHTELAGRLASVPFDGARPARNDPIRVSIGEVIDWIKQTEDGPSGGWTNELLRNRDHHDPLAGAGPETIQEIERAIAELVAKLDPAKALETKFHPPNRKFETFAFFKVVAEVTDADRQVAFEDAVTLDPGVQLDDDLGLPFEHPSLEAGTREIIERIGAAALAKRRAGAPSCLHHLFPPT